MTKTNKKEGKKNPLRHKEKPLNHDKPIQPSNQNRPTNHPLTTKSQPPSHFQPTLSFHHCQPESLVHPPPAINPTQPNPTRPDPTQPTPNPTQAPRLTRSQFSLQLNPFLIATFEAGATYLVPVQLTGRKEGGRRR